MKNCSRKSIVALVYILNACLALSYFPAAWKKANVIPVRKPGKPGHDVSSYHPISLLSLLGKIYERFLLNHLNDHINIVNVIPNTQFGFRASHSTSHQALRVCNETRAGFRRGMVQKLESQKIECHLIERQKIEWTKGRKSIRSNGHLIENPFDRMDI